MHIFLKWLLVIILNVVYIFILSTLRVSISKHKPIKWKIKMSNE